MKRFLHPLLSVTLLILISSCDDDIDHGGFGGKNGRNTLSFGVGVCTPTTPRLSTRAIPLSSGEDGEEPLFLIESVTPMEELFFDTSDTPTTPSTTRGTPVYNQNFDKLVGSFWAVCYGNVSGSSALSPNGTFASTGKHEFTQDEAHSSAKTGTTYKHDYGEGLSWPEDEKLLFFFEAPSQEELGKDGITRYADGRIVFNYTMTKTNAVDQQDLLFGSMVLTKDEYKDREKNNAVIDIPFHHALCAVKFNSGYGADNAAKITKIEIQNVYSEGVCTVNESANPVVSWSGQNTPINVFSNYRNVPDQDDIDPATYADDESDYDFPAKFYHTETNVPTTTNSLNDANFTHTFHLIPQAQRTGEGVVPITFVIHYTIGDESDERIRTVSPTINWAAGNIYTYTLTINDAAVTVSEQTLGGALLTTNSGNVTEYQRVALAANWVTTDGTIVASQPLTSGWLTGLPSTDGVNWRLGSDGYYYYKYPVQPGNAAVNSLYTSRNTVSAPDNHPDATLEFTVTVQAVRAANSKNGDQDVYDGYTVWSSGLDTSFFSDQPEQPANP